MAAVELTITGVLYDKLARTTQQVVLIGEASLTGVGVGGGPVIPPAIASLAVARMPCPGRSDAVPRSLGCRAYFGGCLRPVRRCVMVGTLCCV